ncbi:MAG: type III PLP-dependent enzyme, partial [Roseobacter sp.]|nr:type III PLP-dependent enzyme [Roseobacter sp.]
MTMNATVQGALGVALPVYADAASAYIAANSFDRPTLVIDRQRVAAQYDALSDGLGNAHIHYAVKANPAPQIIRLL